MERAAADIACRCSRARQLEKVVLLIMVTAIFGMALDVAVPPLSLAVAVGTCVVATTLISHWMTRRGYSWDSPSGSSWSRQWSSGPLVLGLTLITPLPGGQAAIIQTGFFVIL